MAARTYVAAPNGLPLAADPTMTPRNMPTPTACRVARFVLVMTSPDRRDGRVARMRTAPTQAATMPGIRVAG
jgi:hypothetical protein